MEGSGDGPGSGKKKEEYPKETPITGVSIHMVT